MLRETPVYSRLVAERGDVPAQVRGEADRIRRDLARVMPAPPPAPGPRVPPAAPAGHRNVLR
ncbi:hypothetical protein [Streptomyces sp. NPDC050388]|uniref:hypothetical protein n=1 Tax=Streptomyces sp. NPDC050388 TaxID=3155781 RepID=UPI0034454A2D